MDKPLNIKECRELLNKKLKLYHVFCQIVILFVVMLLSPLYILISLAILINHLFVEKRFVSPVFYEMRFSQGRYFPTYKFLVYGSDGKLTKVGFLLRKFYLDELPQLINILKGDMVLVGPRPNPTYEYFLIKNQGYYAKVIQRAGLTGGVQVAKGSDRHGDLTLDENYMHFCLNNSLIEIIKFDLKTFLKTLKVMQKAEGI